MKMTRTVQFHRFPDVFAEVVGAWGWDPTDSEDLAFFTRLARDPFFSPATLPGRVPAAGLAVAEPEPVLDPEPVVAEAQPVLILFGLTTD